MSEFILDAQVLRELEESLRRSRGDWLRRLDAIQADRRRQTAPLDPDFADQATQRQNDEPLDALDARGRAEVAAIDDALHRLKAGTYGRCQACNEAIRFERLRALPTATLCSDCARATDAGS